MTLTTDTLRAEWERHGAVMLAWPHSATDWAYMLDEIRGCYRNLVDALLRAGEKVIILAPEAEAEPSENITPTATRSKVRSGYRVQIFDDNNARTAKSEAQARRNRVGARFPEYNTYISFNSPYWRVKIGDFRTRSEAEAAMGAIRAAFPAYGSQLRIVRDRINQ